MNRHLQFAFVTFTATAVVGIAAIILLLVNNGSEAYMYAVSASMKN